MGERIYRLKDGADTGVIPLELCPGCFEKDEFSVNRPRGDVLQCDRCSTDCQVAEPEELYATFSRSGRLSWLLIAPPSCRLLQMPDARRPSGVDAEH